MRRRALVITAAALAAAVAFGWSPAHRYWRAGKMLTALSTAHGGKAAEAAQDPLVEESLTVTGAGGPFRARIYRRRDQAQGQGLLVVHGIHHEGMNEHRMVPFARELARAGLVVLTPEITDLADYRITPQGVSVIRDAAVYLGGRHDLVGDAPVGILGFSFAGGLALVAAEQPPLAGGRLAYVVSVGGHDDLERVLRFLIRNEVETPAGLVHKQAHDYGLVVLLYGYVERFAPEADRAALRDALRASLHQDRPAAVAAAARLTTDRGKQLWQLADSQKLQTLAPELEAIVKEQHAELAALSPRGRLAAIGAPVYLVHGTDDSVIPASETEWAGVELGKADHIALVSPLIEHVEVSKTAGIGDKLALLRFIAQML